MKANHNRLDDAESSSATLPGGNGHARKSRQNKSTTTGETKKDKKGRRRRGPKPYPVMTFEEASKLGQGIIEHGAGHPMKRTTLLKKLSLTDSQATRSLITASGSYVITRGGQGADELALTEFGKQALDPQCSRRQQAQARYELSIKGVDLFFRLYDKYKNGKLPADEAMRDFLNDLDSGDRQQCVDIFVNNATHVGLLKTREGGRFLLSIEALLDELPGRTTGFESASRSADSPADASDVETDHGRDFNKVCFFIAPIGEEGSAERKHSDSVLSSFVEPAIREHGLEVIRADKISTPGMISKQVVQHVLQSKVVVVDMSFGNPSVFYELALRHVSGQPTVHLIRDDDKIPFDVANFRTIKIKMGSVYDVLANLETHRSEIAQQIRQAIADGVSTNNPILTYCPSAKFEFKPG